MKSLSQMEGLKKLNPRSLPADSGLPSKIQQFLSRSSKPAPKITSPFKPSIKKVLEKPQVISKPLQQNSLYQKQLEYSRNYSSYIQEFESGKHREDIFPEMIPKKNNLPLTIENPSKPAKEDSKTLISHLIKPKATNNTKQIKLKGKGLLQGKMIRCARCNKEHDINFHFKEKQANKPAVNISLPHKRERYEADEPEEYSEEIYSEDYEESDDVDDGFIVHDDEEDEEAERVKKMVRKITGFDPRKYSEIDRLSTKGMESSASRVLSEERYSAKIGSLEDQRELERLKRKKH